MIKGNTANLLNIHGRLERISARKVIGEAKSVDRKMGVLSTDRRFCFDISDVPVMETFELNKRPINLSSLRKQWLYLVHVQYPSKNSNSDLFVLSHLSIYRETVFGFFT
jgi:hypothetical protein